MFTAHNPRAVNAYQRINVETSMHTIDQHQLVSLLYEGVLGSVATARGALARGDIQVKCNSIAKAIRIIEEEKLKTRILLAWKKDRRPSAVMQDFINICEKYAGNPAI